MIKITFDTLRNLIYLHFTDTISIFWKYKALNHISPKVCRCIGLLDCQDQWRHVLQSWFKQYHNITRFFNSVADLDPVGAGIFGSPGFLVTKKSLKLNFFHNVVLSKIQFQKIIIWSFWFRVSLYFCIRLWNAIKTVFV